MQRALRRGVRRCRARGFGTRRDRELARRIDGDALALGDEHARAAQRRRRARLGPDQANEAAGRLGQADDGLRQRAARRLQRHHLAAARGPPLAQVVAGLDPVGDRELGRPGPAQGQAPGQRIAAPRLAAVDQPAARFARRGGDGVGRAAAAVHADAIAFDDDVDRRRPDSARRRPRRQRIEARLAHLLAQLHRRQRRQDGEGHALALGVDDAQVAQVVLLDVAIGGDRQGHLHERCRRVDRDRRLVAVRRRLGVRDRGGEHRAGEKRRPAHEARAFRSRHDESPSSATARRKR